VRPNPTSGVAGLRFVLDAPGQARIDVFDVLGRRIALVHSEHLAVGSHSLPLDTGSWPAGVYMVRIAADDAVVTTTFTVAR
jgi:hypothetical protein